MVVCKGSSGNVPASIVNPVYQNHSRQLTFKSSTYRGTLGVGQPSPGFHPLEFYSDTFQPSFGLLWSNQEKPCFVGVDKRLGWSENHITARLQYPTNLPWRPYFPLSSPGAVPSSWSI